MTCLRNRHQYNAVQDMGHRVLVFVPLTNKVIGYDLDIINDDQHVYLSWSSGTNYTNYLVCCGSKRSLPEI